MKLSTALALSALIPAMASAQTTVQWSTLGNFNDANGKPAYIQRFTIGGDTDFARLGFNQFARRMEPLNPADTLIEVVPGYYAVASPRFAAAKGDTVCVDILTHATLSSICYAADGAHRVMADGTTRPVEFSRASIITHPRLYSTDKHDPMPYGDVIYTKNASRPATEAGPYDVIPSFKKVDLLKGMPTDAAKAKVEYVATDNPREDFMQITVDNGKITVATNNRALAEARVGAILSHGGILPAARITDWPDFGYRGLMIDISRNYQTPAEMARILHMMHRYGFNVLHFHVADDEAWRLEIPGLPELTDLGARRGYTLDAKEFLPQIFAGDGNPDTKGNSANGYFTRQDFINTIKLADSLGIRVIPEIESPGHARAALLAMEKRYRDTGDDTYRMVDPDDRSQFTSAQSFHDNVMNLAMPGPVRFMTKVGSEIQKMYQEAGVELPSIHIGGDEVAKGAWTGSPIAKKYMEKHGITNERKLHLIYIRELLEQYNKLGIPISGWQEIAVGHDDDFNQAVRPHVVSVNCWSTLGPRSTVTRQSAEGGYPTVLSNVDHFYMDMCYNYHPDELGLTWGGTVDEFDALHGYPAQLCPVDSAAARNIIGLSGQLFSETVRSGEMLETYLLPKMLGLAERAWNADTTYTDPHFNSVIEQVEIPWWTARGYNFHVSQPGITVENGKLLMNAPYTSAEIRYTLDGSDPDENSTLYTGPVTVPEKAEVRAKAFLPASGKKSLTSILYIPDYTYFDKLLEK